MRGYRNGADVHAEREPLLRCSQAPLSESHIQREFVTVKTPTVRPEADPILNRPRLCIPDACGLETAHFNDAEVRAARRQDGGRSSVPA